jgi:hypothetical protein
MTKAQEGGENEVSRAAKQEATRSGRNVCDILAEWLGEAKAASDRERERKIVQAQKFLKCRNVRKRRSN